jgi:hypothetical protein
VPKPLWAKRVLYLDFDGVLHDEEVYWHPKRGIYMKTPGRALFEWMPVLDSLLLPHPDVKIVLSTSWVRVRSFNFARSRLSPALQERVIGATFHKREMRKDEFVHLSRGEQIAQDVYRRGPHSWFSLDDDHLGWPEWCRNNLIRTDGATGISDPAIQHAIKVMLERF